MTTAGIETKTLGQKAVDRFTEMMIERMEQMKSVGWHKHQDGEGGGHQPAESAHLFQ